MLGKKIKQTEKVGAPLSVFERSLAELTPQELGDAKKVPTKQRIWRILQTVLFCMALAVCAVSLAYCAYRMVAYQKSVDLYDQLAQQFQASQPAEQVATHDGSPLQVMLQGGLPPQLTVLQANRAQNAVTDNGIGSPDDTADADFLASMQLQLAQLRKLNADIGGWIRMEGDTAINYPLVFSHDDTRYLTYAADGSYNPAGAIFMDCRNKAKISENRNTVIYGHNMYSGSPMFANLHKFATDPYYWRNNHFIELYTDEGLFLYVVFAAYADTPVFEENCYFDTTVNTDERMQLFLDAIAEKNLLKTNVLVRPYDKVITLCTCSDAGTGRFVVHGKLIPSKDRIN